MQHAGSAQPLEASPATAAEEEAAVAGVARDGDVQGPQPQEQEQEQQQGQDELASVAAAAAGSLANGESSGAADVDAPRSKRVRLDVLTHAASHLPPTTSLAAFPAGGGTPLPSVDPSLVGAAVSGTVEAVGDCAYFVSLHLAGQEFKGALYCPPASFLDPSAAARPTAPLKKPKTAFNFYSDAVRPGAKEKHPHADQKGISKIVGDMWAQLTPEEKEKHNEEARQDRDRYDRELREYQARFPQGSRTGLQRVPRPPAALQEQYELQPGSARARQQQQQQQTAAAGTLTPQAAAAVAAAAMAAAGSSPWAASLGQEAFMQPSAAVAMPLPQHAGGLTPGWPAGLAGGMVHNSGNASSRDASSLADPGSSGGAAHPQHLLQQQQPQPQPGFRPSWIPQPLMLPQTASLAAGGSTQLASLQLLLQQLGDQQQQQQLGPVLQQQAVVQAAAAAQQAQQAPSLSQLLSALLGEGSAAAQAGAALAGALGAPLSDVLSLYRQLAGQGQQQGGQQPQQRQQQQQPPGAGRQQ